MPPWPPGTDTSVMPQAYRDVLELLADAGGPLRAKQIASGLGMPDDALKVEGLREAEAAGGPWVADRTGTGHVRVAAPPGR